MKDEVVGGGIAKAKLLGAGLSGLATRLRKDRGTSVQEDDGTTGAIVLRLRCLMVKMSYGQERLVRFWWKKEKGRGSLWAQWKRRYRAKGLGIEKVNPRL